MSGARPALVHPKLEGARLGKEENGDQSLLMEVKDGICILTLNRKRAKNGFADMTYLTVVDALNHCETNDDVKIVVITGNGDFFSSGADLHAEMK